MARNLPDADAAVCLGAACVGADLAGDADRLANCAPTASSKKPFEVPATHSGDCSILYLSLLTYFTYRA